MRRKGLILAGGILLLAVTGCGNQKGEEASPAAAQSIPVSVQSQKDAEDADRPLDSKKQDGDGNGETGNPNPAAIQGTEELLGNVVSIGENSVVVSQSFTEESQDGGAEVMWAPAQGSENEVLVNVICTADTQYEYKTVKNSGINPEDVETRAGNFSDIKENLHLAMTGSYQGNDFYAVKVSISEFVS